MPSSLGRMIALSAIRVPAHHVVVLVVVAVSPSQSFPSDAIARLRGKDISIAIDCFTKSSVLIYHLSGAKKDKRYTC